MTQDEQELDEILNKYVSNYNLDVLGFRESGQASVKRAIRALKECWQLEALEDLRMNLVICDDHHIDGFRDGWNKATKVYESHLIAAKAQLTSSNKDKEGDDLL